MKQNEVDNAMNTIQSLISERDRLRFLLWETDRAIEALRKVYEIDSEISAEEQVKA